MWIKYRGLLLLFGILALIHAGKITNGFTWLDHRDIEAGRSLIPLGNIFQAFTRSFSDTHFYRPIVSITHTLNGLLFSGNPFGYHLFSVLLHCLTSVAVYSLSSQVFKLGQRASYVSAFCFGILPASFLPAGQISHVSESLLAFFYIQAIVSFFRHSNENSKKAGLAFAIYFGLALFSKESALVFIPFTIALLIYKLPIASEKPKTARSLIYLSTVPALIYLGLRSLALPSVWALDSPPLDAGSWIAVRIVAYSAHLISLLNPLTPPLSDVISIYNLSDLQTLLGAILFILLGGLLYFTRRKSIQTPLLLLLFLLAPTLQLLPLPRFYSSHYLYLPGLMLAVILGTLISEGGRYWKMLLIPWVVIATGATAWSGQRLSNDFTLFSEEVKKDPRYREGHFYLGGHFLMHSQYADAERHYLESLRPEPDVFSYRDPLAASIGLAITEMNLGKHTDAERILEVIQARAVGSDLENILKLRSMLQLKGL